MLQEHFLVTGAKGMLGMAVVDHLRSRGEKVTGTDLPDADLTDPAAARALILRLRPTRVIHCAAYTAVDKAESDEELCRRVNVLMPRNVGAACAEAGASMLLVSTDFVFDGRAREPYPVDAPAAPEGVYARTKYEGELALAEVLPRHQIARTAWLFGPGKRNFVSGMFDRLRQGMQLRVVDDQTGNPTYTRDLAKCLVALSTKEAFGIFHAVNAGQTTWCGLTRKTAEIAGFDPHTVATIRTEDYPTPARRPAYSVLDCSRTWALGIEPMRPWEKALREYVQLLLREGSAGR
jgi:dTDP-4-dehydrorhamnose reductase